MKGAGPVIAVIGNGLEDDTLNALAEQTGYLIAESGCVLMNGGLAGVIRASAKGAKARGGLTIGFLPGADPGAANQYIDIPIPTGLGEMRNLLVVRSAAVVKRIQDDLFTVGANLALPAGTDSAECKVPPITEEDIAALEEDIDACESLLEPLQQFILPGGSGGGAMLHFARTVARRAERSCVTLSSIETVDPKIIRYLNRVSDLCFVLARDVNRQSGRPESHPTFRKR